MSREIYGSTVGEPVAWKSGCIEEDNKEDSEKKTMGAEAATYIQVYGERAKRKSSD